MPAYDTIQSDPLLTGHFQDNSVVTDYLSFGAHTVVHQNLEEFQWKWELFD